VRRRLLISDANILIDMNAGVGQMVDARVIVVRQTVAAYRRMRDAGRRLPWEDVEDQLHAFGK
jgi:hypothetical protein